MVHGGKRSGARLGPCHNLREHRVVVRRHFVSCSHARLDANLCILHLALAATPGERVDGAGLGNKAFRRIFGVEARLDRMTVARKARPIGQLFACRNAKLPLDEVEPRDHLRHRMFDLKARVHFEKKQLALIVGDEFARARAHVVHLAHDAHGGLEKLGTARLAFGSLEEPRRRRRLFDNLLMTSLQTALTLAEREDLPVRVAEHLHLDVPRLRDISLQIHARVRERRRAPVRTTLKRLREAGLFLHDLHADAAAATDRLHQDRITDARSLRAGRIESFGSGDIERCVDSGHRRDPRRESHLARLHFVSKGLKHRRSWPHEHGPRRRYSLGKG